MRAGEGLTQWLAGSLLLYREMGSTLDPLPFAQDTWSLRQRAADALFLPLFRSVDDQDK